MVFVVVLAVFIFPVLLVVFVRPPADRLFRLAERLGCHVETVRRHGGDGDELVIYTGLRRDHTGALVPFDSNGGGGRR